MPRFLCTADLHIGRQSSGFNEETALGALGRIVDLAIDGRADALLIAGDLFDSIDAQFLTRNQVAAELNRLKSSGIRAIAVAGNHDWDALPTFAHACPGLIELIGAVEWESIQVGEVMIVGCSFGAQTSKPLMERFKGGDDARLSIGLLHADIDAHSSYNPTPLGALAGRGVQAWVLGHVHAGRLWDNPPAFYPGSPQALDAGETGIHGVRWLITDGAKVSISDPAPLSTVRFENVVVQMGPDESVDDAVAAEIQRLAVADERMNLRVRLRRLSGASLTVPDGLVALDRHFYEVIDTLDAIEPDLDLKREAQQSDARGQAARLLLGLEEDGDPEWIRQAKQLVEQVRAEMEANRRKLKLGGREEFQQLEVPLENESVLAVRASLESVLSVTAGGRR